MCLMLMPKLLLEVLLSKRYQDTKEQECSGTWDAYLYHELCNYIGKAYKINQNKQAYEKGPSPGFILLKLEAMPISISRCSGAEEWLFGWALRVLINGTKSRWRSVTAV